MPINFPIPSFVGELYTFNQTTWEWSGEYWGVYSGQTGYITTATTVGSGYSAVSGVSNNTIYLKSFSGDNVTITDNNDTLVFSTVLYNANNTITVALTGSTGVDFNSIKDAVNSITGATSANTYTVKVSGGVYYEDPFTIPSWVAVVGESSISTIIQANDSSQTLIKLSDQSAIFDCQVQGCTDTNVSAILYSSSTTPQSSAISYVENVRFGSNYTHAKVVASGGANIIMQCSNVKYGGYPFTVGFYATNDGSGIGRMQLRNVTSTNGGVVTTSGLIFAKADAQSCGFIVNGCLLTKAQGLAAGTGFYVENGGFLRLTAVNFQRWSVGIDAPQIGAAPSIDAIALNFENNTIDVNIAHSGATGKIQGTDNFLKTIINQNAPLYEVNQDPKEITVAKKGGDFSSIKSAVDYLISSGNTSITNRYVISVGPGVFVENEIDLTQTPYVSIVGSNIQTTQILPNTNTQHIIKIGQNNELSFLSLSGAPSGYAGIYCYDIGDFGQAHKLSFYDCDTNVWVESVTQDTKFYGEYLDYNGEYEYGTKVIGNNGYVALANMENYFNFPTGTGITYCNYATGSGATLSVFVGDNQTNGVSGSTAFYIQDSAELNASTITVDGFTYGIRNPNIGGSVRFDVDNASFVDGEWDLYVESINTFGTLGGSSSHQKLFTNSSDVYWALLDIDDGEFDITRKISVTFTDGSHTDLSTLVFEGGSMGLISGGTLSIVSGTTVQADGGFGYLEKSDDSGIVRRIDWINNQITLSANTDEYIFINENSNLTSSGGRPDTQFNILLGRVVTNSTDVEFIDLSPFNAEHTSNRFGDLFSEALGPIFATGSIVTEGTTPYTIDVTGGDYFFATNQYLPVGGTGITFTQYYRNGTGTTWVTTATTIVNHTQYDNNGTLTTLTAGHFAKHTLYLVGDGSYENYFLVLSQAEYATLVQAENALLSTPPTFFSDSVTQIANIYVQKMAVGIIQVEDIRPTIAFRAGGVNASSVHGNLLGLGADDHTQYLLVSGSRAMSGNLDMGVNDITNVGTVDGVTVSAHAARHQFGGLDPVGSTTPTPNAIPYADVSGTLDSWVSTATTGNLGLVKVSTTPVSPSNPIVLGENDVRFLSSFTGGSYSNGTLSLNNVSGGTYNVNGFFTGGTDVFVTGATYNNNTFTYTNNTGGTFNVSFNDVTGLTSTGTISSSVISATTYQNLPSTSITVGTTPIVSGTAGRILFESTGNTVQQDGELFWDNTNKRLGIGKTPAASSAKAVVAITDATANQNFYLTLRNLSAGYGSWGFVKLGSNDFGINYQTDSDVPQSGTSIRFYYGGQIGITSSVSIGNIGTPSARLDVRAQGALSSDVTFRIRNSADSVTLNEHRGDGSWLHRNNDNSWYEYFDGSTKIEYRKVGQFEIGTNNDVTSFNFTCNSGNVLLRGGTNIINVVTGGNYHFEESTGILSTSGAGAIVLKNRTAPSSSVTDRFYLYSDDITAGNAAPHFRTEAGNIVKLYTYSAVTTTQGIADALTTLGLLSASTITTGGSASGDYLPLSGGTVTGDTIFTQSLSSNVFSATTLVHTPSIEVTTINAPVFGTVIETDTFNMYDSSGINSINWDTRILTDSSSNTILDWQNGTLLNLTQLESIIISATTYQNLPTDVFVTGGTYSSGTATFTNNTGGTFNVTGFVSEDTFVTGVTYSSNVLTISQNEGQTPLTATIGLKTKSGSVVSGSFTGNPKKASVTFSTAFSNTNYSIQITGTDNRSFTYESKTTTGFTINTNANTSLTGDVDWVAIEHGES